MSATYLYYPGCSMDGSARAYAESLDVVCRWLGLRLEELDDWNCCGATEYLNLSPLKAHALVGRNLALAERQRDGGQQLVAPCSACFVNLAKTEHAVRTTPALAGRVNAALAAGELSYTPGSVVVRHLVEVILQDVGVDAVAAHVTRPLRGLRVAPYLGCLVTRPDYDHRWRSHEHPREFDRLLGALGADVVDYPLRTDCCGGHMTQISPGTGFELIRRLVEAAELLKADLLVTICPMCQMNVDAYQAEMNRFFHTSHHMPILFFTQLMGLAFGAEADAVGVGSEIVSARAALGRIGIEVPEPEQAEAPAAKRRPRREAGLPMPAPLGEEVPR
ncbi:MAG TPA: CoB--CoM heterodisulfide reductase iron-sulfur subunit B family protein [Candidatus Dormibacteraeota bacterium]|nr:CoB--CoM heterodisulfide reductase iron-sulfur subunit B family protein [Candidatus Dormibacteraeota bacterium]